MKYFICAGEASGDLHASQLIEALKREDPAAEFLFLGGDLMAEASGGEPIVHYRDMAFMGFIDVVRHLGAVRRNLRMAKEAIAEGRPDAVILVDYPSFNLRIARTAFDRGIPVYYYISPKVWAWKEGRVKSIKRLVKKMYSILPFEPEFYRSRHGYDVEYVGNPSAEEVDRKRPALPTLDAFVASHGLEAGKPVLALVPGSRVSEIKNNLKIMGEVARRHPDLQPVIAGAPNIGADLYRSLSTIPVVYGATFDLLGVAEAALVTSGTATLEAALLGTPQVVMFRHGGSKLVYNMYKRLLKIPYVSLPNLIAGRQVVPELLMHLCTPDSVDRELNCILPGAEGRAGMLEGYTLMRERLGTSPAAATTARLLLADLRK